MYPQSTSIGGCKFTLVAFVWLFSTMRFQVCPQMSYLRRCKVTLAAFIRLDDIVSCFLQDFYICILWNRVKNHLFFHRHWVLCCAQKVASNWVKFIVDLLTPVQCSKHIRKDPSPQEDFPEMSPASLEHQQGSKGIQKVLLQTCQQIGVYIWPKSNLQNKNKHNLFDKWPNKFTSHKIRVSNTP